MGKTCTGGTSAHLSIFFLFIFVRLYESYESAGALTCQLPSDLALLPDSLGLFSPLVLGGGVL